MIEFLKMNEFTSISVGVILIFWIYFFFKLLILNKKDRILKNKKRIEDYPSFVSTLGVLGTFIGITLGLLDFDTNNIEQSIPILLSGLKTAFFTSLAGMFFSLLLSKQVNRYLDNAEKEKQDTTGSSAIIDILNKLLQINQEQNQKNTEYQNSSLQFQNEINSKLSDISKKTSNLIETLHNEVVDIEQNMAKTNDLLVQKFDEFSELLKKSNTEALVEVMKKVTEEFQKQMGELINRLVQENFEQLNQSVERLNTWQIENKEMISSLTLQYKQMAENFEATSTTLTQVEGNTKLLVSDGGKLQKIIKALNAVMIEDEKFVEISKNMAETSNMAKTNMEMFNETTIKVNEWVKKQRNFVESVNLLIAKLEEINKINDYSEVFWKGTKKGFEEAVGSIKQNVANLNNEIEKIDKHFYERLEATFSQIDSLLEAKIKNIR